MPAPARCVQRQAAQLQPPLRLAGLQRLPLQRRPVGGTPRRRGQRAATSASRSTRLAGGSKWRAAGVHAGPRNQVPAAPSAPATQAAGRRGTLRSLAAARPPPHTHTRRPAMHPLRPACAWGRPQQGTLAYICLWQVLDTVACSSRITMCAWQPRLTARPLQSARARGTRALAPAGRGLVMTCTQPQAWACAGEGTRAAGVAASKVSHASKEHGMRAPRQHYRGASPGALLPAASSLKIPAGKACAWLTRPPSWLAFASV